MTKTLQKIELGTVEVVPLDKLVLSQSNVRRIKAGVSIAELAQDIARRGLLSALAVRPLRDETGGETGNYEVPAGGRRFQALQQLVKAKRLAKSAPVPCIVKRGETGVSAEDDSLAENVHRVALHPLDQFRAFQTLADQGQSEEEIAANWFVTPAVVRQRLRLANVSPALLDHYAEDTLSLDQLMAFTVTTDHARQEAAFERIQTGWNKEPYFIRSLLTQGAVDARDRRARYVGIAAYEAAGGTWAGPAEDEHFGAAPLFVAKTEGATPFRFALHVGDVGHCLVVGPTGAGKSVLLALMALQFRRYARAQIFAFDFGGSIRAATLACGGDWHDLGGGIADSADAVALQPLAGIDAAAERAWAVDWLAALLGREGVMVDPQVKDHLWTALLSLSSAPVAERTLTGLAVLLQSQALKQALAPFTVGGPWGRLLDAEAERIGDADWLAFETEGLIGTPAAPAVLAYLFHRIEARLDGRPTLIIIDEGWLALDDEGFAAQLREWLKTLRKKNASVVFATQSLADIDGSSIAPAIIESCPTRLFLPNERALEPQITAVYRRFGLNDRQIEILSRATPKRDYYCQSRRGNRLFELGLGEVALAFTATSARSDQNLISALVETHGCDGFPAAWLAARGLGWAIPLIA